MINFWSSLKNWLVIHLTKTFCHTFSSKYSILVVPFLTSQYWLSGILNCRLRLLLTKVEVFISLKLRLPYLYWHLCSVCATAHFSQKEWPTMGLLWWDSKFYTTEAQNHFRKDQLEALVKNGYAIIHVLTFDASHLSYVCIPFL